MGCCFSRNDDSNRNPPPSFPHPVSDSHISRLKPPHLHPQPEEETVKEVLSETPSQKRPSFKKMEEQKPNPILPSFPKIQLQEDEEEEKKIEKEAPFYAIQQDVSEVSEICSLSESYSTTVTERREDEEGEVRQRVDRSPAKVPRRRSNPGEFGVGTERGRKSPARRSEPSPGRKYDNAVRYGSNTEMGQAGRRRIAAGGNNRTWRDPGESSGRRSRSPSTRTDTGQGKPGLGLGRSPSSRKTGRSPARIPPVATPDKNLKLEEFKEGNGLTNESLENPLVSLECFIFL